MIRNKIKNYKTIASLACLAAVFGVSNAANAKPAKCELSIDGGGNYNGPCNFVPMGGGSFEISALEKRKNLIGDLESIVVWVGSAADLPPNEAFYAYTRRGEAGRNGSYLKRQKSRPACWVGEYDKICVF
jgi:hypothetical protein